MLLECATEWHVRLKLEGMDPAGKWNPLAAAPEVSEGLLPVGLRRRAVEELKARGIRYFLAYDGDWYDDDYKSKAKQWGFTQVGEWNGARLYRLD